VRRTPDVDRGLYPVGHSIVDLVFVPVPYHGRPLAGEQCEAHGRVVLAVPQGRIAVGSGPVCAQNEQVVPLLVVQPFGVPSARHRQDEALHNQGDHDDPAVTKVTAPRRA
jgi:hypothetical protein